MNWKVFAAFIAGGVVGGLGTWYGVRKHYKSLADEEIAIMTEHYRKKLKEAEDTNTVSVELPVDITEEKKKEVLELLKKAPSSVNVVEETPSERLRTASKRDRESTPYSSMYKEKPSLEDLKAAMEHPMDDDEIPEDALEEGVEAVLEPQPDILPGPYVISEEDYASDWRFEKITITYYSGDQTLADEDETIIDDVDRVVSDEAIKQLVDEDLGAIYVRNEKLGIDYEVTLNYGDYSEIVLGFTDEEVGGRHPMKRRKEKPSDDE